MWWLEENLIIGLSIFCQSLLIMAATVESAFCFGETELLNFLVIYLNDPSLPSSVQRREKGILSFTIQKMMWDPLNYQLRKYLLSLLKIFYSTLKEFLFHLNIKDSPVWFNVEAMTYFSIKIDCR
ncbi:uncharacterized protein LOC123274128 [Cotesia glomerata]|uniref:uncharacterized protein LOC123274128 n=1 Tax=Cotesia glomerata TaxID=32391 RepID=UPI001D01E2D3|nr:uncharacterized protein LOC123274128 [Cotesia glomerata]